MVEVSFVEGHFLARVRAHPDVADVVVFSADVRGRQSRVAAIAAHSFCNVCEVRDALWADGEPVPVALLALMDDVAWLGQGTSGWEAAVLSSAEFAAPASRTEVALARIWCEVLERERVGLHDDFLDAGGDSLRAMTMLDRVDRELGVCVSYADFATSSTLSDLAGLIRGAAGRP